MARTRNISIGVPAELHARYADLGMAARRAVLAEVRRVLERRLVAGWSATETDLPDGPVRAQALEPKGHEVQGTALARGTAEGDQSVTLPNGW